MQDTKDKQPETVKRLNAISVGLLMNTVLSHRDTPVLCLHSPACTKLSWHVVLLCLN